MQEGATGQQSTGSREKAREAGAMSARHDRWRAWVEWREAARGQQKQLDKDSLVKASGQGCDAAQSCGTGAEERRSWRHARAMRALVQNIRARIPYFRVLRHTKAGSFGCLSVLELVD